MKIPLALSFAAQEKKSAFIGCFRRHLRIEPLSHCCDTFSLRMQPLNWDAAAVIFTVICTIKTKSTAEFRFPKTSRVNLPLASLRHIFNHSSIHLICASILGCITRMVCMLPTIFSCLFYTSAIQNRT